jgi:hypothetical protein
MNFGTRLPQAIMGSPGILSSRSVSSSPPSQAAVSSLPPSSSSLEIKAFPYSMPVLPRPERWMLGCINRVSPESVLLPHPPPPLPHMMQLGSPLPPALPPSADQLSRISLHSPSLIPSSEPFDPAQYLADGLIGLFRDLRYDHGTGSVYLTLSQYRLLHSPSKEYQEQVGVLDLACTLGRGRDRGLFFEILADRIIPALQQSFSVDPSMPVVVQKQIGLVRMLGKFVRCGTGRTTHRGVLDGVKLEVYQSIETVVLVFKVPEFWEIRLGMAQLTNGSAYCDEIREDD